VSALINVIDIGKFAITATSEPSLLNAKDYSDPYKFSKVIDHLKSKLSFSSIVMKLQD
jgi:hypothetical protein